MPTFAEVAIQHWENRGSRRTHVRVVLCEVIGRQTTPFTAETLLPLARALDRGISMASVYRTLADLSAFDLLHESRGRNNESCYTVVPFGSTPMINSVSTLVCRDCGKLHPLDNSCLVMRESIAAKKAGFTPRKLDLRIEADCETLHDTGQCEHRKPKPSM